MSVSLSSLPRVGHAAPVRCLEVSDDGMQLASADVDRNLLLWQKSGSDWNCVESLSFWNTNDRLHPVDTIRSVRFDSLGRYLYAITGETILALDAQTLTTMWVTDAKPTLVFMITTPLGLARSVRDEVAVSYVDGHVEVYAHDAKEPYVRFFDHNAPVEMDFLGSSSLLAGTDRYQISVFDSTTGVCELRFNPKEKLFRFAASPDGKIAAVRTLHHVAVFDFVSESFTLGSEARPGLPTLAFSRDGAHFVTLDYYGFAWCDRDGKEVAHVQTSKVAPLSASFGPDALWIGFADGSIEAFSAGPQI